MSEEGTIGDTEENSVAKEVGPKKKRGKKEPKKSRRKSKRRDKKSQPTNNDVPKILGMDEYVVNGIASPIAAKDESEEIPKTRGQSKRYSKRASKISKKPSRGSMRKSKRSTTSSKDDSTSSRGVSKRNKKSGGAEKSKRRDKKKRSKPPKKKRSKGVESSSSESMSESKEDELDILSPMAKEEVPDIMKKIEMVATTRKESPRPSEMIAKLVSPIKSTPKAIAKQDQKESESPVKIAVKPEESEYAELATRDVNVKEDEPVRRRPSVQKSKPVVVDEIVQPSKQATIIKKDPRAPKKSPIKVMKKQNLTDASSSSATSLTSSTENSQGRSNNVINETSSFGESKELQLRNEIDPSDNDIDKDDLSDDSDDDNTSDRKGSVSKTVAPESGDSRKESKAGEGGKKKRKKKRKKGKSKVDEDDEEEGGFLGLFGGKEKDLEKGKRKRKKKHRKKGKRRGSESRSDMDLKERISCGECNCNDYCFTMNSFLTLFPLLLSLVKVYYIRKYLLHLTLLGDLFNAFTRLIIASAMSYALLFFVQITSQPGTNKFPPSFYATLYGICALLISNGGVLVSFEQHLPESPRVTTSILCWVHSSFNLLALNFILFSGVKR